MVDQRPSIHHLTVNKYVYEFAAYITTGGGFLIEAPGIMPFHAATIEHAKDILFSVYSEH